MPACVRIIPVCCCGVQYQRDDARLSRLFSVSLARLPLPPLRLLRLPRKIYDGPKCLFYARARERRDKNDPRRARRRHSDELWPRGVGEGGDARATRQG